MISRCGRAALVGALAATLTTAAACGYGTTSSQPSYSAPHAAGQVKGKQVAVRLAEYNIALGKSNLSPGTYTFMLKNVGKTTHALAISGPGVNQTSGSVDSGGTTTLTVTLKPGTYDVWCPIDDHRGLGMETSLTVK
ncbi:hypothetical protein [Nonomuraea sediminis]|uniref:hypothetical protein n=1 Tax=Nonomuraea sediminis TaxID=2835864 RepID=UPI001BDD3811|nr:hypothetical protein [Nonomuraea sediminis]